MTTRALEGRRLTKTAEGKDWIFVSDAHFNGRKPGEMDPFVRFLEEEKDRMETLVILGDLFEFFFGFQGNTPKGGRPPGHPSFAFADYLPILEQLQRLYRRGVRIKYFEGNHDFSLASFFFEHFGMEVEVYPQESEERLGGRKAYLAHGDLSNPRQWGYRALRRTLKNRWAYGVIRWMGPRFSRKVARCMSEVSYDLSHPDDLQEAPPAFRAFAHQKFLEGFEVVVLGHSHFPEKVEERIDGRSCLYFNTGDWRTHQSFLRFTPPEQFRLEGFEGGRKER